MGSLVGLPAQDDASGPSRLSRRLPTMAAFEQYRTVHSAIRRIQKA